MSRSRLTDGDIYATIMRVSKKLFDNAYANIDIRYKKCIDILYDFYDKRGAFNKDERVSRKYYNWRIKVLERDHYKCQHCSSKNNLHAHHIKRFVDYPELRFDINNGLTLCKSCHIEIHKNNGFFLSTSL